MVFWLEWQQKQDLYYSAGFVSVAPLQWHYYQSLSCNVTVELSYTDSLLSFCPASTTNKKKTCQQLLIAELHHILCSVQTSPSRTAWLSLDDHLGGKITGKRRPHRPSASARIVLPSELPDVHGWRCNYAVWEGIKRGMLRDRSPT